MAFGALPPGQPGNWSIFDKDGAKALDFDTFFSCSIKAENKISSNPVEKGSFADYNKVASPTAVSVVMGRTGKSDELAAFLEALDKLAESTDLVSIVTPEKTSPTTTTARLKTAWTGCLWGSCCKKSGRSIRSTAMKR